MPITNPLSFPPVDSSGSVAGKQTVKKANQPKCTTPANGPPAVGRFTLFAQSRVGKILGSHTVKRLSGVLIGVSILLIPTGIGIGLIAAGAGLWMFSTALSIAAKNPDATTTSILMKSVFWGLTGVASGMYLMLGLGLLFDLAASVGPTMDLIAHPKFQRCIGGPELSSGDS